MAKEGAMQLQMDKEKVTGGIRLRRVIANIVLILLCLLCLFWFYILLINATHSNAELSGGRFHIFFGKFFGANFMSLMKSSINIWRGMLNSVIIAGASAILSTYFSSMTAYAIHCYDFKLKKFIFTAFWNVSALALVSFCQASIKKPSTFCILGGMSKSALLKVALITYPFFGSSSNSAGFASSGMRKLISPLVTRPAV